MSIKLILFVSILAVHFNCMKSIQGDNWQNPKLTCSLKSFEKPVQHHPTPANNTVIGFENFCTKMQKRFSESNLSKEEAEHIYFLLEKSKEIADQQSGMPSPNLPRNYSLKVEELKKRVALKKISETEIEAFYYYSRCGTNFIHNRIILSGKEIEKVQSIESWSGVAPC